MTGEYSGHVISINQSQVSITSPLVLPPVLSVLARWTTPVLLRFSLSFRLTIMCRVLSILTNIQVM